MDEDDEGCEICAHDWTEHNGMGDCMHLDGRTSSGYCAAHVAFERHAL